MAASGKTLVVHQGQAVLVTEYAQGTRAAGSEQTFHELGHLLLGTNSHAPTGIMRARWQPADLANASQGRLLFSSLESREMRNKLAASHPQVLDDSQVVTARLGD